MGAQRLERSMSDTRSRSGILLGLAAAAGAFGAAAMMSATVAPTARADDFSDIVSAVDGDYTVGQTDFTAALSDFGSGAFVPGLAAFFGGVNEDTLAAPDNLILGTVEALEGDPITSTLYMDDLSVPGSFADASAAAQIFFNEGEGFLSNAAIDFSGGDYGAGTYQELVGGAYAFVLPVEELLLGAVAPFDVGVY
jgi:hypothetical protein